MKERIPLGIVSPLANTSRVDGDDDHSVESALDAKSKINAGCFPLLSWVIPSAAGQFDLLGPATEILIPHSGATGETISGACPDNATTSAMFVGANDKNADNVSPTTTLQTPLLRKSSSSDISSACGVKHEQGRSRSIKLQVAYVVAVMTLAGILCFGLAPFITVRGPTDLSSICTNNCTFVSGGGFSGFYYLLGRLRAQRDALRDSDFLCYSAGCLSVAAFLMDQTGEQTIGFGLDAQNRYRAGTMPWLNATEQMVANVVQHYTEQHCYTLYWSPLQQPSFLRRMHIMTTTYDYDSDDAWWWWPPRPRLVIRTPQTLPELQEMLLQTSWIPFVTGFGWTRRGHNDAVLSLWAHPSSSSSSSSSSMRKCAIPNDWVIYANAVNVLMPANRAQALFNRGLRDSEAMMSVDQMLFEVPQ